MQQAVSAALTQAAAERGHRSERGTPSAAAAPGGSRGCPRLQDKQPTPAEVSHAP